MSIPPDLLIDRARLKSRLKLWRLLAILSLFGAVAIVAGRLDGHRAQGGIGRDYIALLPVEGEMDDSPWRSDTLKDIADDPHAKAVIVRFDSPGGTAIAGEELYLQLQQLAKKKPVVGVMRTLCASACFMASLGTDYVVARESTLTGSIGVLLQSVEISRLADKLGVTPITITSGAMKDVPSLTEPLPAEKRAIIAETVTDVYNHFIQKLVARRHFSDARARQLGDGRVYTGAQAVKLGLIDDIGAQDEALDWLEKQRQIPADLDVQEMKEEPEFQSIFDRLGSYANQKIFGRASVRLDGMLSIWHPALQ